MERGVDRMDWTGLWDVLDVMDWIYESGNTWSNVAMGSGDNGSFGLRQVDWLDVPASEDEMETRRHETVERRRNIHLFEITFQVKYSFPYPFLSISASTTSYLFFQSHHPLSCLLDHSHSHVPSSLRSSFATVASNLLAALGNARSHTLIPRFARHSGAVAHV